MDECIVVLNRSQALCLADALRNASDMSLFDATDSAPIIEVAFTTDGLVKVHTPFGTFEAESRCMDVEID